MEPIKRRKWDSVDYLKTDEDMLLSLASCVEVAGDDSAFLSKALSDIARAKLRRDMATPEASMTLETHTVMKLLPEKTCGE